jgi:hypothetical protein
LDFHIPYPVNRIRRMNVIDHTTLEDYPELFKIIPVKFYEYFTDYQSLYINEQIDIFTTSLAKPSITEIFAPALQINCKFLVQFFPHIEKLEVGCCENMEHLKKTQIKYLKTNNHVMLDTHAGNLPDTIESLIVMKGWHIASSFDQLDRFPCLSYVKIELPLYLVSIVSIDTVHLMYSRANSYGRSNTIILPNVKNIIIDNTDAEDPEKEIYLTSQNAITCQLVNMRMTDVVLNLPNCLGVNKI